MTSAEQCNIAQEELLAFLDKLTIADADKSQIISLSSNVVRLAAISGMEASKGITERMLDQISNDRDDTFVNNISRSAGIAIISSIDILIKSVDQQETIQNP